METPSKVWPNTGPKWVRSPVNGACQRNAIAALIRVAKRSCVAVPAATDNETDAC